MKKTAYLISFIAILILLIVSVQHPVNINWNLYTIFFIMGCVGLFFIHKKKLKRSSDEKQKEKSLEDLKLNLKRIREEVNNLDKNKDQINTGDVYSIIEEKIYSHVYDFINSREIIKKTVGLSVYADILSHFSAGERFLNRIYSASCDGYSDEIDKYLPISLNEFIEAEALLLK